MLDSLDDADRRRVLACATRRRYGRRDVLFHANDPGRGVHLLESGKVAVRIGTADGGDALIGVLGPGQVVGTPVALGADPGRATSVVALEPTETLSIDRARFAALRSAHPTVDAFVVDALVADVLRANTLLLDALFAPVELRLLRRLVDLTAVYGGPAHGPAPVEIALTQQDLASLAGTSRATANRVLRELEDAGTVRLTRNRIHVVDLPALAERAR
ncbi:MAG: Crp/Fnr family transcriptional regulator [Sporichthyaceae bacterium]